MLGYITLSHAEWTRSRRHIGENSGLLRTVVISGKPASLGLPEAHTVRTQTGPHTRSSQYTCRRWTSESTLPLPCLQQAVINHQMAAISLKCLAPSTLCFRMSWAFRFYQSQVLFLPDCNCNQLFLTFLLHSAVLFILPLCAVSKR